MPPLFSVRMAVFAMSVLAFVLFVSYHGGWAAFWFATAVALWIANGRKPVFQLGERKARPAKPVAPTYAGAAIERPSGATERDPSGCYDRLAPGWRRWLDGAARDND